MPYIRTAEEFFVAFCDIIIKWFVFGKPYMGMYPLVTLYGGPIYDAYNMF